MKKLTGGILLIGIVLSLKTHADVPPTPSLSRVKLSSENLESIYKLMPVNEVVVPNAIQEKGARVLRKIHRDPKVDDRYNSGSLKRALICERTEYQRNKSIPAVNKYACSEVVAIRTSLPTKDADLLKFEVDETIVND